MGWASKDRLRKDLEQAEANTKAYIDSHLHICYSIGKPLVMEEFGYPRDNFSFVPGSPTTARDAYYRYVFTLIADNAKAGGKFAGCNFWAWGGHAKPCHEHWQQGDDYCGDPSQEAQGLNSLFVVDKSTMKVVKEAIKNINKITK